MIYTLVMPIYPVLETWIHLESYQCGQYNMGSSVCTGNFYSGAGGITGRFSKVREPYKARQPMFLLMTSDALSSGLRKHFRFQYTEVLRFFYKMKRRSLDQTSIPHALGCYI